MMRLNSDEVAAGQWAKGRGCSECRGTGFKGRIGVFELIAGTHEFRAGIANKVDFPELVNIARKQGFRTMMEDGKQKAMTGWTTPDEVLKAVYTQALD
jgi:type II secretory ATPase GspE/PulE/Tfp pilus assembly ATPase PilB-like protein